MANKNDYSNSRRNFIKLSAASFIGAGLFMQYPNLFAKEELKTEHTTAEHIIYLFMVGGMSHIDTFDPKPGKPVQGKFKTIEANNGRLISDQLPLLAKCMDRITLINSMTSKEGSHPRGQYMLHTNYPPLGTIVHPTLGSWVSKFTKPINQVLPPFISIGKDKFGAGYFGSKFESLNIAKPQLGLANIKYSNDLNEKRFNERIDLLKELDEDFQKNHKNSNVETYNNYYQDALKIMFSEDVKVFDLQNESEETRNNYGSSDFANGCLLARRLVEKGVKFIDISFNGWDTHEDNFDRLEIQCQTIDKAISSLILDLEKRGLLKKTLIVLGTEFGRSPKINGKDGRDHHPKAFSCLLAGGGIKGGQIIGKTDELGEKVIERPVTINDLNTTIAYAAGLDPNIEVNSPVGRPFKLSNNGNIIEGVFS